MKNTISSSGRLDKKTRVVILSLMGVLLLTQIGSILPHAFADVNGPMVVYPGSTFTIHLDVENSNVYCAYVTLQIPDGFSADSTYFNAPVVTDVSVQAPSYPTTGTFSAMLFYWPTMNCSGTSYVNYAGSYTVTVFQPQTSSVTFNIYYTGGQVLGAYVNVYDHWGGNLITQGGGESDCTTCAVNVQVQLPSGTYYIAIQAKVAGTDGYGQNAIGSDTITVSGDSAFLETVSTFCC